MKQPAVEVVDLRIEQHGVDVLAFEIKPRKIGLDAGVEPRCFDQPAHQGTTSPAASSSGRGALAKHRITVRKAAEARDDVAVEPGIFDLLVVAELGEQQYPAILVGEFLAVLERHVEELRSSC